MIIRTPRNPNVSGLGRARRGLGDAPQEPQYQSCESGTLAGVLCEQANAVARTNWLSAVDQAKCDAGKGCDLAADAAGNLTRLTPGGTPDVLGWNPSGADSLVVTNAPVFASSPTGPGYSAPAPSPTVSQSPVLAAVAPAASNIGSGWESLPDVPSWFIQSMIGGIPNWMLLAAGAGALFLFGGSRGR